MRAVYFSLLGAEMPSQPIVVDVALMELPLMFRFSACLLMALFWVAVLVTYGYMNETMLLRRYWMTFGFSNLIIYGVMAYGVGAFSFVKVRLA